MARRVRWSQKADDDRNAIFAYWNERNFSYTYSRKLDKLFEEAILLIRNHPFIGRKTIIENVHLYVVRDYLILYEVSDSEIIIHRVLDGRMDNESLSL